MVSVVLVLLAAVGQDLFADAPGGWWESKRRNVGRGTNYVKLSHRRLVAEEKAELRVEIRHATVFNTKAVYAEQIAIRVGELTEVAQCGAQGEAEERPSEGAISSYNTCPISWAVSEALMAAEEAEFQLDTNVKRHQVQKLGPGDLREMQQAREPGNSG